MSEITTMTELMGEVLRLRQQLFDEQSLHVASQLCLKAQTESVQGCAQKLAEVTQNKQYHMDCINLLAKHIGRLGDTSHTVVNAAIQQLAEMTKERDFYKKAMRTAGYDALLSCGHTYEEHVAKVFAQWKQAIDDALNAERQLANVDALMDDPQALAAYLGERGKGKL